MRVLALWLGLVGCGGSATTTPLPDADLTDTDGDGNPNVIDNCPDVPNPLQQDKDLDGVGDVCDNCPHVPNEDQGNGDGDQLGDQCEPPGENLFDCIVVFEGFDNLARWQPEPTWIASGGVLRQTSLGETSLVSNAGFANPYVEAAMTIETTAALLDRRVLLYARADRNAGIDLPDGFAAGVVSDPSAIDRARIEVTERLASTTTVLATAPIPPAPADANLLIDTGSDVVLKLDTRHDPDYLAQLAVKTVGAMGGSGFLALPGGPAPFVADQRIALYTSNVTLNVRYVLVTVARQAGDCPARQ